MGLSRSQQMARVQGRHTKPELRLRSLLWARGYRYRLHARGLPGTPDLVFPARRTVVFVDGCFWHGCPQHYVRPRSRSLFWSRKLLENVTRDRAQSQSLHSIGWQVVRLWEHDVLATPEKALSIVEGVLLGKRDSHRRPSWRVIAVHPLDRNGTWETRTLGTLSSAHRTRIELHRRHTRKWRSSESPASPTVRAPRTER